MAAMVVKKCQDHKGVLGLRVSFGTVEQMKQVIKALDEPSVRWVEMWDVRQGKHHEV